MFEKIYLQATSMRIPEDVMLEGEVLQQPTMPVVKETNMKKKDTMKRAIIPRPMSGKKERIVIGVVIARLPRSARNI